MPCKNPARKGMKKAELGNKLMKVWSKKKGK